MGLRITTNMSSITAQRHLLRSKRDLDSTLEKLASGYRINKAGDDAAGLAISEKLRSRTRGLAQAQRNANDGISLVQVAEGGLNEMQNILIRLRELGVQAASDTLGARERKYLNEEFGALKDEIDRIANGADFNGTKLLNGTGGILDIQVNTGGENILGVDRIIIPAFKADANLDKIGLDFTEIGTKGEAQKALATIENAIDTISGMRGDFGAIQNRLASTVENISVSIENLQAAKSRIKDVDIAEETANLTKNNILVQAGVSVLAQANNLPKAALTLLQQ